MNDEQLASKTAISDIGESNRPITTIQCVGWSSEKPDSVVNDSSNVLMGCRRWGGGSSVKTHQFFDCFENSLEMLQGINRFFRHGPSCLLAIKSLPQPGVS
jgi:hypothetical protein